MGHDGTSLDDAACDAFDADMLLFGHSLFGDLAWALMDVAHTLDGCDEGCSGWGHPSVHIAPELFATVN